MNTKVNPFAPFSKCEFERHLNELPFPAKLPQDLKPKVGSRPGRQPKQFGNWLHEHNYGEFIRRYEKWRAEQLNNNLSG